MMNGGTTIGDPRRCAGSTYIEVLVGSLLLMMTLLSLCGTFVTAYAYVTSAGNSTMGLAAARQALEDVRQIPFDQLINLHGFDTEDPDSVPADGVEQDIARRWRYALAGDGVGWAFTDAELASWHTMGIQGNDLGGSGRIDVVAQTADLVEVSVSISVPGSWRPIRLSTLIARF
jgi:Tfp pilus assembly protein PilV